MNFGIIGSGMIAAVHAMALREMRGGCLHSVFNHHAEGAEKLAAAHGVRAFSSLAEFLADPDLDAVTICTPSGAHLEPALAALAAGKHVIVEKPLEVTTARIDRMIAAAAATGKSLSSVLNRRFTPAMDAFRQAAAGRFGKLTSASCYVKWFRDQAYYDSAPWRGTVALDGGGALMNQAIHAIDALLHLAGPVRSVRADTTCLATTCSGHGTCDASSGTPTCTCDEGYAGTGCADCATGYHIDGDECVKDSAECTATSCSGHGSCDASSGTPVCTCALKRQARPSQSSCSCSISPRTPGLSRCHTVARKA